MLGLKLIHVSKSGHWGLSLSPKQVEDESELQG